MKDLEVSNPHGQVTIAPGQFEVPGGRAEGLRSIAKAGVRALLELAGVDPDRPGMVETPRRVVDAFLEMTAAPGKPADLLQRVFNDAGPVDQMVVLDPIEFASLCEHHLLPFTGTASVAYLPADDRIVGLSKLGRLVEHYARQLQVQERMTNQICQALVEHLQPLGAAVTVRASHSCMALRGIRKPGGVMTTTALAGRMLEDPASRAEYFATIQAPAR